MGFKNKEVARVYWRDYYHKKRRAIFTLLGDVCCQCGFSDRRALHIDHINGGGGQERKKYQNSINFFNKVLKDIADGKEEYQILCANCNWIKRYDRNELKSPYGV